ncbi:hypothetical protein [Phaffia rhodozyma]|uniref:Uncharacterized protein n=1 Tax=Phaffia rhodozyma TaxID=264483 RepID=A0A0F7SJN0_PHARH|nr:hypothetical protein [Phaffia rhodozyma]
MSNNTYTPLPVSQEHLGDSLATSPVFSQNHAASSNPASYPPPPVHETPLAENLCSYKLSLPGAFTSDLDVICTRGSSKEDIVDQLSSISSNILSRTPLDRIIFQIPVGGQWSTVLDSSFDDAIVRGRPDRVRVSIALSRKEWWRTYGLLLASPFIFFFLIILWGFWMSS